MAHYDGLKQQAEATVRTATPPSGLKRLHAVGVPMAQVRFPVELFDDEQACANGMFHRLRHATAGDFTEPAPPVAIDGDGFRVRGSAAVRVRQQAVLGELGFSSAEVDALIANDITRQRTGEEE